MRSENDHDFFRGGSYFHCDPWEYVLERIHDIQGFDDASYKNSGYGTHVFWVDGDTTDQRRTEIIMSGFVDFLTISVSYLDENGDFIPEEKGGKQELFLFNQFIEEETQRRISNNTNTTSENNAEDSAKSEAWPKKSPTTAQNEAVGDFMRKHRAGEERK